jgi:hypothetical protein
MSTLSPQPELNTTNPVHPLTHTPPSDRCVMNSSHLLITLEATMLSFIVWDEIFFFYVFFNGLKGGMGVSRYEVRGV